MASYALQDDSSRRGLDDGGGGRMASYVMQDDSSRRGLDNDKGGEDEEEDLFEINLDTVSGVSPPHQWEGYFTATGNVALFANCLLPISKVSSAIPTATDAYKSLSMAEQLMMFPFRSYSYLEEIQGCSKRISKGI